MSLYLSRRYQLSASHRLFCPELRAEGNAALYGKCANPHGHGHNYQVEVTLGGELDPVTGMVCDLRSLDACVERAVLAEYDHTNLNLHADFAECVPTTENLCVALYNRLAPLVAVDVRPARLEQVSVEETANNAFTYTPHPLTLEAGYALRAAAQMRAGQMRAGRMRTGKMREA